MAQHLQLRSYKLSASLGAQYAPLIVRGRNLDEQTPKAEFPARREASAVNIDLWVDGSIYPRNPLNCKQPPFRTVSELLEFVAEGKRGLLGYTESLCTADKLVQFNLLEAQKEIQTLGDQVCSLTVAAKDSLRTTSVKASERVRVESENRDMQTELESLKIVVGTLRAEYDELKLSYEQCLLNENCSAEDRLQLEVDLWIAVESLKESYETKLEAIRSDLRRTKATLR